MMAVLRRLWFQLLHALRPARGEAALSREIAAHLAVIEDHLQQQGLTPSDAHREARRRLGGLERTKALQRDARSVRWLDQLRRDVRDARRSLMRHRRATAVAILILASTGTINALILGVADRVLLRPLPYRDASRLFVVMMRDERSGQRGTYVPGSVVNVFKEPRNELSSAGMLDSLAPVRSDPPADGVRRLSVNRVTRHYLDILGVTPVVGRLFREHDQHGRAAVITHEVWMMRFGGEPGAVGQTIAAGGRTFDIVGVLPPRLFFPSLFGEAPDILTLADFPSPDPADREGAFYPIVRLGRGVTLEGAQAKVAALTTALVPDAPSGRASPELVPVNDVLFPSGRPIMRFLLAAAGLLVVIACVNLGGIVLVRWRHRAHEIGVRIALGAHPYQLARPMFFEIVFVAVASGVVACVAGRLVFETVLTQIPRVAYGNAPVGLDLRVALMTIGCGLVGALVFAFVPVWRAITRDGQTSLRTGTSRRSPSDWSFGRTLVTIQVALAVLLVFGAVITARAFHDVLSVPLGFDPDRVATFNLPIPTDTDRLWFLSAALERIRQHPAVRAAGAFGHVPFDGAAPDEAAMLPGESGPLAGIVHTLPGAHEALGMSLLKGRVLAPGDERRDVNAAVVSERAAKVLFGDANPLGGLVQSSSGRTLHVVGVVGDVRDSVVRDPAPTVYMMPTAGRRSLVMVVKLNERRDDVVRELQTHLGIPPSSMQASPWYADRIARVAEYRNPRFQTIVLATLGVAALFLTVCGIAGVVGFLVSSRTRELGIRLVVGARPARLVSFVVLQGAAPVLIGLVAGLGATYWIGKLAEAQLFKVNASDPAALAITALVILVAASTAAYVPARRAGRIDPVVALRTE